MFKSYSKDLVAALQTAIFFILSVGALSDSPHIVSLSPSGSVSGQVGSRVRLSCEAEASPPPAYQWVQKLGDQYVIRGNSRMLVLDNIIFEVRTMMNKTRHEVVLM